MKRNIILFGLIGCASLAWGQDLENVGEKPFSISGSTSATTQFYGISGAPQRREPFFWQANINLNVKALGIDMPFSATFSQQQSDFSQPFNQYGLSPKYKWLTVHLGWRSLSLSKYTLAGNIFLGGGVEINHPKSPVKLTVLYGRFAKAIEAVALAQTGATNVQPAFERRGFGMKLSYPNKLGTLDLSFFRGEDDRNSIARVDSLLDLRPAENLALALSGNIKIDKKTSLTFEVARSFYTQDTYQSESKIEDFTFTDNLGALLHTNSSTGINNAIDLSVNRNFKFLQANLSYRRLDPNFQSMGTPFLNNDIQSITGGVNFGLFKKKVNITANLGSERDNLDNSKRDQMNRLVFNGSMGISAIKKLSLNLTASNMTSSSVQVAIVDIDSLLFFQVTRNYAANASYQLASGSRPQNLTLSASSQITEDLQRNNSNNQSLNLGYGINFTAIGLSANASFNFFRNDINPIIANGYGPTLAFSKKLFKDKVSANLSLSNAQATQDGVKNSDVYSSRLAMSMKTGERGNLSVDANVISKRPVDSATTGFTEYRGGINYSYSF